MPIDIRTIDPAVRPATVFKAFDALAVGESVEIVNDHDPVGLRGFFHSFRPGTYSWEATENGPELWKARITRTAPGKGDEPDTSALGCGCH